MQNELNVVGIQADLIWENPERNLAFFEEKIIRLSKDTDLVVLPEMFTTGFTMKPEIVAEKMDGKSVSWMLKMAKEKNLAICGSLVITQKGNFYNRLVFVHPSGKIEIYDKKHSFTLAGEDKVYTSGSEKLIVNYKGWKICPLICYDLRFPVWARNTENYDLLIFMANWPTIRIKAWKTLLKARAIENMSYVIGVNRTGKDANNYQYTGNSLLIDYLGEESSNLKKNEVGIIKATLFKDKQTKGREKLSFLIDMDAFKIEQ
ncbi:nitrilase family protein [Polaribacter sp. HaHaR_3_91]|uniref:nitrilase family protein n=1 Tax=Polaribacter sp. HaHaR_3_91 TaxID=2745561 RepID=UPI001C4FF818|nr:nitrilase family protein [Polaribacter sp. HaHaR_3_91]QXP63960.1 nitrilase family protein [Polaribacter sp. HaHaR_3_91]